jgi:hypothetical protein
LKLVDNIPVVAVLLNSIILHALLVFNLIIHFMLLIIVTSRSVIHTCVEILMCILYVKNVMDLYIWTKSQRVANIMKNVGGVNKLTTLFTACFVMFCTLTRINVQSYKDKKISKTFLVYRQNREIRLCLNYKSLLLMKSRI